MVFVSDLLCCSFMRCLILRLERGCVGIGLIFMGVCEKDDEKRRKSCALGAEDFVVFIVVF